MFNRSSVIRLTAIAAIAACIAAAYTTAPPPAIAQVKRQLATRVPQPPKPVRFRVAFTTPIHTKDIEEGQDIEAVLKTPIKSDDDVLVAPVGSKICGTVDRLTPSKVMQPLRHGRRPHVHSQLVLTFNRIVLPDNSELDMSADAIEQLSVFSNGESIREVQVGPGGSLLKAFDTDLYHNADFGVLFPESWTKLRDRMQVDIEPGDQITLEATVPTHINVSGRVVIRKSR